MIFDVTIQHPKPFKYGQCCVDIDKDGSARLSDPTELVTRGAMERVKISICGADVMIISGMEPDGATKKGVPKFTYQEWILRHMNAK